MAGPLGGLLSLLQSQDDPYEPGGRSLSEYDLAGQRLVRQPFVEPDQPLDDVSAAALAAKLYGEAGSEDVALRWANQLTADQLRDILLEAPTEDQQERGEIHDPVVNQRIHDLIQGRGYGTIEDVPEYQRDLLIELATQYPGLFDR